MCSSAHDLLFHLVHIGAFALDHKDGLLVDVGGANASAELGDQVLDLGALLPHNLRHHGGVLHGDGVAEVLLRVKVRVVVWFEAKQFGGSFTLAATPR